MLLRFQFLRWGRTVGILEKLFRGAEPRPAAALTAEQRRGWERDGYLLLREVVSPQEVASVRAVVDDEWRRRAGNDHVVDVLSGPWAGQVFRMAEVPPDARGHAYKLNNLFARRSEIRRVALSPRLRAVCADLLEGEPLICNSLNFERGSQQPAHIDNWYMPPPVENRMVAASIALDDVDADNGPIVYYPGSHRIAPFPAKGRDNESHDSQAYLRAQVAARGLQPVEVRARSGDVFIWHAQLLHGGQPIRDPERTRSSLVVHYWRVRDMPREQVRRDPAAGSYLGYTLRGEIRF